MAGSKMKKPAIRPTEAFSGVASTARPMGEESENRRPFKPLSRQKGR